MYSVYDTYDDKKELTNVRVDFNKRTTLKSISLKKNTDIHPKCFKKWTYLKYLNLFADLWIQ